MNEENSIATNITGIEKIIQEAMDKSENFSGIGVKWAEAGKRFIMEGYNEFNMFKNR